jgi:CheY-like chemotaxis protein
MNTDKTSVLLVDDDIDYLEQLKFQITNFGFEVTTAESRKEAEEILETFKPSIIITDLMMENQDSGFVLAYQAKRKYPEVPVIIATNVTSESGLKFNLETEEDKNWIKADLYLEKGIRADQLHREINKLLKL